MSLLCSIDGKIAPVAEATVSISDEGFLRGDGAFEMLKLYGGKPFAIEDHLDRMARSCEGIFLDWDRPAFETEIAALLEANSQHDGELRLVITRAGRRMAIIEAPHDFRHGITLSSVPYQPTVVLTGLKTLSYAANMNATRIARHDGADEALLVRPDGAVLEAPTATIFWVTEGTLHTPRLEAGVLASITRDRIMQVSPVEEGDGYKLEHVLAASEVFLASSLREVQGVLSLDGLDFAPCPGPVTQRVAGLLSERIAAEISA